MKSLLLLALIFCFIGCSSPATLKGEIFVSTVTGNSVKFGAIPVYIFKKKTADGLDTVFGNTHKADFVATTDGDGKFSISVPKGDYVIAVKAERHILDDTENYQWLYPVSVTSDTSVSLNHTNAKN
jgi:hypothetical protein